LESREITGLRIHEVEANEIVREVDAAGDEADDRHEDVVDERFDDRRERRTDDDTDGKIKDISACDEFAEFLEHEVLLFFGREGRVRNIAKRGGPRKRFFDKWDRLPTDECHSRRPKLRAPWRLRCRRAAAIGGGLPPARKKSGARRTLGLA